MDKMNNDMSVWNLTITDNQKYHIESLKKYCKAIDIQFKLNKNKKNFSLIEKFVYDVAKFSCQTKNINVDDENKHITFWTKHKNDCISCQNFHVDIDDYEVDIKKTNLLSPLITNITYLNKCNNPTLFTNIQKNKVCNNKNVCIAFPNELTSILFDGGNYYHGPFLLDDDDVNKNNERFLIIVSIWDNDFPCYVPTYEESIFSYKIYRMYEEEINKFIIIKNESFIHFKNINNITNVIKIDKNHKIIYDNFFDNLFISYNDSFLEIKNIIKNNINEKSNIYLLEYISEHGSIDNSVKNVEDVKNVEEINNIVYNNIYNDLNCPFIVDDNSNNGCSEPISFNNVMDDNINYWDLSFADIKGGDDPFTILLNNCHHDHEKMLWHLLDHKKKDFTIIEKYIYDISKFHLDRIKTDLDDNIYIEFWFKKKGYLNMHIDSDDISVNKNGISKKPFLSCITYLNDSDIPTIFTNISVDGYKFKLFNNKNLLFSFPKKMRHILFNGGKYFHSQGNVFNNSDNLHQERYVLLINYWYKYKPLNIDYYKDITKINLDNNNLRLYRYNRDIKPFIIFNKPDDNYTNIELKNDNMVDFDFFQEILYDKKDKNIFYKFDELLKDHYVNNKKMIILSTTKQCDLTLKKTAFNTPLKFNYKNLFNWHIINNFIHINYCNYIIKEYEKYIFSNNLNTDINKEIEIEKIPSIFNCIMKNYIEKIIKCVEEKYNLSNYNFNIIKLYISNHYNNVNHNNNNNHNDGNNKMVLIVLNKNDIKLFNNEIAKQGDMIIFDYISKHNMSRYINNNLIMLLINLDITK